MAVVTPPLNPNARIGWVAPMGIYCHVTPSDALPDLTVATGADIVVTKPGGLVEHWASVFTDKVPGMATVFHGYGPSDLLVGGIYSLRVVLTGPFGTVETSSAAITVKA
jgi:hypothetical protein